MMLPGEWTRPRPASRCLSDLAFDQLAAGEDPGPLTKQAWHAHLRQCPACEDRRSELAAQRAALLVRRPSLALPEATAPRRRPRLVWLAGALALPALAAVIVVVNRPPAPGVRLKGGLGLEVFVKRAGGRVELLLPEAPVTEGDALRFRVSTDAGGVVALVGVDAAGVVSSYDPTPQALPVLSPGERRLLDGSIVLDGSVGNERLVALLCRDREQAAAAIDGVRHAPAHGEIAAAPGCRQTVFPFRKVARP